MWSASLVVSVTDKPSPNAPDVASLSSTGGSEAARAYREQLARQGANPGAAPAPATAPTPAPVQPGAAAMAGEARAAERKKVSGRARLVVAGSEPVIGKMLDLSLTGACVLMEDMIPSKKMCTLECDIFHDGKRYLFSVQAVSVYGVLASGKGFRVGFQFGPCTPAAAKAIGMLLA